MKRTKTEKSEWGEIVLPFGEDSPVGELFDDCPICQELKRKMEAGEIEEMPIQVPLEGEDE